jgi:hypothetical protein
MGVLVISIPTITPVLTFITYLVIIKQPLTAAQAFTALSLFNILRFPLFQLPQIVTQVCCNVCHNMALAGSSSWFWCDSLPLVMVASGCYYA